GADAENAAREGRGERAEIGVAAQNQVPAAYGALRGTHAHLGAVRVGERLRIFENARSRRLGGARQTLSVLEGMQVSAARVDQSAEIALAAHMGLKFG